MSNITIIASESLELGSTTASSTTPQYSAISAHSSVTGTPTAIREWLMLSQVDSPASPSQSRGSSKAQTTAETCGLKHSPSFASYDHVSRSWKTCQVSWLTPTLDEYSETWPKAGMTVDGVCYPQSNAGTPNTEHPLGVCSCSFGWMFTNMFEHCSQLFECSLGRGSSG